MSKMVYKQILRATNLPKTVNIEQNYMDYILDEGAHYHGAASKAKDVWYNHFIGFYTDKSNPEWGFGYADLKEMDYHYPIFTDKVEYQIEGEDNWKEKPYIVMFYGSDNCSKFIRFTTINEVVSFLNKEHKSIDQIEDNYQMEFYNS